MSANLRIRERVLDGKRAAQVVGTDITGRVLLQYTDGEREWVIETVLQRVRS